MNPRAACVLFLVISSPAAMAVVTSAGNPNNTEPGGQPYFSNIGTLNGASAIYLGDGWVLTANHVAPSLPTAVNFGGASYITADRTWQRLLNPTGPDLSTSTDIVLFRLATSLVLPSLTISSVSPAGGTEVMLIGNGRIRDEQVFYNRTVFDPGDSNDTWAKTETVAGSNISGFTTTSTNEVRWGTNNVTGSNLNLNVGSAEVPVNVISFSTTFDQSGPPDEAQAVLGDSGSGVFRQTGGAWELAGMTFAVGLLENQPGGSSTAFYGDSTYIADLSQYRSQILAATVPESSSGLLALASLGALTIRRRR